MGLHLPKRRRICSLQRELWNVSGQCLVLLTRERGKRHEQSKISRADPMEPSPTTVGCGPRLNYSPRNLRLMVGSGPLTNPEIRPQPQLFPNYSILTLTLSDIICFSLSLSLSLTLAVLFSLSLSLSLSLSHPVPACRCRTQSPSRSLSPSSRQRRPLQHQPARLRPAPACTSLLDAVHSSTDLTTLQLRLATHQLRSSTARWILKLA
ncbi:hypothetical protein PanWU01x14_290580 [Parasponia andersonii]|uniref:Uncharacterized protein n=1 Tax=Parasponia andersonii TaxID=3476 RepID=A0A2P5AXQ7_PARAD|nr:hypothetical protein PanWU01x14_290580 [Parasponia andersonii]